MTSFSLIFLSGLLRRLLKEHGLRLRGLSCCLRCSRRYGNCFLRCIRRFANCRLNCLNCSLCSDYSNCCSNCLHGTYCSMCVSACLPYLRSAVAVDERSYWWNGSDSL